MVRTRSFGVKVGGKSSKKAASSSGATTSAGSSSASKKTEAGNSVQVQPTPAWQREITGFLGNPSKKPRLEDDDSLTDVNESGKEVEVGAKEAAKETAEENKTAENKAEEDSVNGTNNSKEKQASTEGKVLLEKEGLKQDEPSKKENGSVGNVNGCKIIDDNGTEKNGSALPVLAEGNDKVQ